MEVKYKLDNKTGKLGVYLDGKKARTPTASEFNLLMEKIDKWMKTQ